MAIKLNLTGKKYHLLTVVGEYFGFNGTGWSCICDCGESKNVRTNDLRQQKVKSCGCHRSITSKNKAIKHGLRYTREYRIWCNMKSRCTNVNFPKYPRYGGRGIEICDRWLGSFKNFFDDMGKATTPTHSIDRIDNNGNYEPSNCRWATPLQQAHNKG